MVATPPDMGITSKPDALDRRLYVQESIACQEVQSHTETVRTIVNNYDKAPLFSDACFLYNALISVWEKSECFTEAPARLDCCAEIGSRYSHYLDFMNRGALSNQCVPEMFNSACPKFRAFKQQCDLMGCSPGCPMDYDCSPDGFAMLVRTIPSNATRSVETEKCVEIGYKIYLPQ